MKQAIICITFSLLLFTSCKEENNNAGKLSSVKVTEMNNDVNFKSGYSEVNGIRMYYEIHGAGAPLVLIHGGGSTIETSFGRIIPVLAKKYSVIAVDLQNHGRSGMRTVPQTFEQDADDVAALLKNLGIARASFFGFSNGGTTALQIAIRHPELADKLVLASALLKRNGMMPGFFDMMQQASLDNMPHELKEAFLKVNPDSAALQNMFEKDRDRMIAFSDISDAQIQSVKAPVLLINADADVVTPEHTVAMYRLIPVCRLAIVPGIHGSYIGEITTLNQNEDTGIVLSMVEKFLNAENEHSGESAAGKE